MQFVYFTIQNVFQKCDLQADLGTTAVIKLPSSQTRIAHFLSNLNTVHLNTFMLYLMMLMMKMINESVSTTNTQNCFSWEFHNWAC